MNRDIKESVRTLLLETCPWLFFCWCFAHRLELAVADEFKDTQFGEIDEILFYLYKMSPKKFTELTDIFESLKEDLNFVEAGVKPKIACGTRWVTHKVNAVKMFFEK